jgi:protein gp37
MNRIMEPWQAQRTAKRIFVCSQGELFSPAVPDTWVEAVLTEVKMCDMHTFIFLTKNPHLLAQWNPWPQNAWVGATVTDQSSFWAATAQLADVRATVCFLSVEPLLGRVTWPMKVARGWLWPLFKPDWLIIGAQTGPGCKKHWPHRAWVDELVTAANRAHIPIFMKDNLRRPFLSLIIRQEWPRGA